YHAGKLFLPTTRVKRAASVGSVCGQGGLRVSYGFNCSTTDERFGWSACQGRARPVSYSTSSPVSARPFSSKRRGCSGNPEHPLSDPISHRDSALTQRPRILSTSSSSIL